MRRIQAHLHAGRSLIRLLLDNKTFTAELIIYMETEKKYVQAMAQASVLSGLEDRYVGPGQNQKAYPSEKSFNYRHYRAPGAVRALDRHDCQMRREKISRAGG